MRGATGTDTMCMLRSRLISPQDPYPPPSDPFLPTCARKDSSLSDNIFSIMSLSNHSCRQHTGAVTVANHARRSAQQAHLKERREAARLCAAPLAPIPCACSVAVSYRRKIHIRRPQIRFSLPSSFTPLRFRAEGFQNLRRGGSISFEQMVTNFKFQYRLHGSFQASLQNNPVSRLQGARW